MLEIDLEDPYTREQIDNIIEFENIMIKMFYEKYALGEIKEEIYCRNNEELTEQYASLSVKSDKG